MKQNGYHSYTELADKASLHRSYLSRIINGKQAPSSEALNRLADALGGKLGRLLFAAGKITLDPSKLDKETLLSWAIAILNELCESGNPECKTDDQERETGDPECETDDQELEALIAIVGFPFDVGAVQWKRRLTRLIQGLMDLLDKAIDERNAITNRSWVDRPQLIRAPLRKMEEKAEDLLRQYCKEWERISSPPIPVERIARRCFGFRCVEENLTVYGRDVLGLLRPWTREIVVSCHSYNEGQRRFSQAHETGHLYLHRHLWQDNPLLITRKGLRSPEEREANAFASALLMPQELLRRWAQRYSLYDPVQRYALARDFGTSVEAMERRLLSLGLVSLRTLKKTNMPVRRRSSEWSARR